MFLVRKTVARCNGIYGYVLNFFGRYFIKLRKIIHSAFKLFLHQICQSVQIFGLVRIQIFKSKNYNFQLLRHFLVMEKSTEFFEA